MTEKMRNSEPSTENKEVVLTDDNPYTQLKILERRYVDARLQGLPIVAAARAAGIACPDKACSKYERSPRVRRAIRWVIKESTKSAEELTKTDVMQGMLDAVDAAATSQELVGAWRELGKLIGAYEPERRVLEIHDYTPDELKELNDAELAKLAGKRMGGAIDAEFEEVS